MGYNKITIGFVIQKFNDEGECTEQSFIAGDQVDYEDAAGEPVETPTDEKYQPFDMVQPKGEPPKG